MDETRALRIQEKVKKTKADDDLADTLKQAKSLLGTVPSIETEEFPILSTRNGKYRIDEKHLALMFLGGIQQEKDGRMIPKYAGVSRMLQIPEATLRHWWKDRREIEKQQALIKDKGIKYLATAFMVEEIRMVQSLRSINYEDLFDSPSSFKNFINLFNVLSNRVLLYNRLPTSKTEHQHTGGVAMILPDKE